MKTSKDIIFAVPKGRIYEEISPVLQKLNIEGEKDFYNKDSRKLIFSSNRKNLKLIKVRSFDVATFIASGAADFGICGLDVTKEFGYTNLYNLINLNLGKCRLSLAGIEENKLENYPTHVKVATKYVNLTKQFFTEKGIQSEIIKLNGAIELAAHLKLCDFIVDLVSTGNTLKENNLKEKEVILNIASYLVVNQNSYLCFNDFFKEIEQILL